MNLIYDHNPKVGCVGLCSLHLSLALSLSLSLCFSLRDGMRQGIYSNLRNMDLLLCCLQMFLDHCEDFVRQLDSVTDINLFLTELK